MNNQRMSGQPKKRRNLGTMMLIIPHVTLIKYYL